MVDRRIGNRVREQRERLNLSQATLAEQMSVRQSSISAIEMGKVSPTAEVLLKLSASLHVGIDWLLCNDTYIGATPAESGLDELERTAVQLLRSQSIEHQRDLISILTLIVKFSSGK